MPVERIGVFGTCQIVGIAAALKQRFPTAVIDGFHVPVHPTPATELAEDAAQYDLIVTQFVEDAAHPLSAESLRRHGVLVVQIPMILFTGFHPDLIYLASNGQPLDGPFGAMQPALAVAGYVLGLSEEQILTLYNSYVFAALGYFAEFDTSKQEFEATFRAFGIDIAPSFERWAKSPNAFMYTINHPSIEVIVDITHLALRDFGVFSLANRAYPPDALANSVRWHVLPHIAARAGLRPDGGYLLATAPAGDRPSFTHREFVHATYQALAPIRGATLMYGRMKYIVETLDRLLVRSYDRLETFVPPSGRAELEKSLPHV